jgi:hypothetical protein
MLQNMCVLLSQSKSIGLSGSETITAQAYLTLYSRHIKVKACRRNNKPVSLPK